MRKELLIAAGAALALAGCEGAGTDPTVDGTSLVTCTVSCAGTTPPVTTPPGTTPPPGTTTPPPTTNTSNVPANGDKTIALESSVLVSPSGGSVSRLTLTPAAGANAAKAKFEIDTKSANNGTWPTAKTMDEYLPGTASSGGLGMGGNYNEYRALSSSGGATLDEELQVWSFNNSYATQYRDATGGGEAKHQAWSFGGTKTASMPNSGTGVYNGRFGATAKSWNWVEGNNPAKTVNANNLWRLDGNSQITADFAANSVTGVLTPTRWNAANTNGAFTDVDPTDPTDPNNPGFLNSPIVLRGTMTGNTYAGTAALTGNWVSGDNQMYGGFFGPAAQETTGVFSVLATAPQPIGGNPPINDDRRGYLEMSGAFHGQ